MKPTKFRIWCLQHQYTAQQVAEKTGISVKSIYAYFTGVRNPNKRSRQKLRKIGVDTLEIFGE